MRGKIITVVIGGNWNKQWNSKTIDYKVSKTIDYKVYRRVRILLGLQEEG
jgi:hypothetical protein